jgi:iron complex outermembrane receptor protein
LNWKFQNNVNNGAFPLVNGVAEALTNPFNLEQNAVAAMHDKTSNTSLQLQHFGNKVQFNSISAWQQNQRIYDAPLDGDFSPADAVTILNDFGKEWNKVSVYTQEFRWNNTASKISRVNWTAGSYLFLQKNPAKQATHFGKDAGLLGAPMTDFSTINTTRGKNYGIAFFGQANYALTEKLNIIAGLRIDQESKQLSVKGEFQPDGSSAFETQSDTTANASFTALSPKLGLNLALTENNNLYLSYTRGYRTGGFTQLSSDPSQPPLYPFNPEFSDNLELGIKNTWLQNKLRLNVTLFSTIATQVQVPTLVLPDAITITRNTGKLKSKGVEVEIYTTPLKGLQLDYTLGITNASYSALSISQNGSNMNLSGKKQIYTPKNTSLLALQYSLPLNKKKEEKISARIEWKQIGTQYFDLGNQIRQLPYSLINLRAGIATPKFELHFWGRNLSNQKYIAYAYDFGAVHLGAPLTYGSTLSIRL